MTSDPAPRGSARLDGIDFLKAAAIVAVVFTHSGVFLFNPRFTDWDRWLTTGWVWFHVPTFLMVSGFLYFRIEPVSARHVGRRLVRVLVPYVIATLVMQLSGVSQTKSLEAALFQLATGAAVGFYYFVPLICACILCIWPLSRAPQALILALWLLLLAYTTATGMDPTLRPSQNPFWNQRNAIENFYLGYFLTGWLAAIHWSRIAAFARRWRFTLLVVCVAALVYWLQGFDTFPRKWVKILGVLYVWSMAGFILLATLGLRAPAFVRWLSDATYTIYLYHGTPILRTHKYVIQWAPPARILFRAALALGSASLLVVAVRRILGPARAHRYFGC
jgi:fucose 4-O-acetylase-like acetyltransferase